MLAGPRNLVRAQFVEGQVLDFEKSTLFEVGRSNAPPTPEVVVQPITDYVAEGQFGLNLRLVLEVRIFRKTCERKRQRIEDLLGEDVMRKACRTGVLTGFVERSAEKTD